ncbi:transcriptional regulator MtlR [Carnobacterium sp. 17-4]|uniref:BglG family transcription antiterminator n=1 Tax=Carnobacterium sp. (strain 17-4) TaxID=208596 RepID=UPI0002058A17|nr:BglG family transcription antiterminator [Carnobacterium sp. 17-4]AEB30082.1 transcriptional regulator MtlR [Carnobacterium sp. 17-4]
MKELYISNREKKIIEILLEQKNGVSLDYLSDELQVSNRTIYRELSSLESTLAQYQIKLIRELDIGYRLVGKPALFRELQQQLYASPEEFTAQQRQSALVIKLLTQENEVKMESLAIDLQVSISTIQADLVSIEEVFKAYQIDIERKKAKGIQAMASESNRRLIISGLIHSEINEYDFFQLLENETKAQDKEWGNGQNPFLKQLTKEDLYHVYAVVKQFGQHYFDEVTDSQLQRLVILLCVSIMRLREGYQITSFKTNTFLTDSNQTKSLETATAIYEFMQKLYGMTIPKEEIQFLGLQIQGLNVPLRNDFFSQEYDADLGYKVRELIQLVSNEMDWNFNQDETLFHDLLAHITAALKRAIAPMPESNNPLLDKISTQYSQLSFSVKENLTHIFPLIHFLPNEIVYIVIHFASAYERQPKIQELKALVICSSGVGTAKILESRIRKHIPEITVIEISRISKLHRIDFNEYDLILSTIFLQGFETEYKVVTPLLMDNEIKSIQLYVRQIINEKIKGKVRKETLVLTTPQTDKSEFKEFYQKLTLANGVLENFDLHQTIGMMDLNSIISAICESLEGEFLTDGKHVATKLMERMELAPIGLPNTNMALFHCIDATIKQPFFSIYELPNTMDVLGIDRNPVHMKRVLMMLGPDPLSENAQEILGFISSAIVESDLTMEIFNSGSEPLLNNYLSGLFLEKLKK